MTVDPRITQIIAEHHRTRAIIVVKSEPADFPVDSAAPTPSATLITDAQLSALLDTLLPPITAGVELALAAIKSRRLGWSEAVALGTAVVGVVSAAVRDGAPLIQGQSARALVLVIFSVLFDRYVVPLLPIWVRPFGGIIKGGVVKGLESLYQALIKKQQ